VIRAVLTVASPLVVLYIFDRLPLVQMWSNVATAPSQKWFGLYLQIALVDAFGGCMLDSQAFPEQDFGAIHRRRSE
jgi:hypothetical protein